MDTILEVRNISKSFNGLKVLEQASFAVQTGTIAAFFGENGSGKTTLFHIISGFLKADGGELRCKNVPIPHPTPVGVAQLGIGRVWQNPRICRNLSVLDNLLLASRNHPGESIRNYIMRPGKIVAEEKSRKQKAVEIARHTALDGKLSQIAGELSFGQQKLLSIGMLLMNESSLLLLDEPFAGVNAKMVDHISEVMGNLKRQGKTVMMIEHNRTKATSISDMQFFLSKGQVIKGNSNTYCEHSEDEAEGLVSSDTSEYMRRSSFAQRIDQDAAQISGVALKNIEVCS
uniref:ABC transporter-related protein n=1 Tax=Chlorobium phaeobacteroides (strain BS1) TaxID=331678 RepID=B3ENC7_CHLPB